MCILHIYWTEQVVGLSKKKEGAKELGEIKLVDLSNLGSGCALPNVR